MGTDTRLDVALQHLITQGTLDTVQAEAVADAVAPLLPAERDRSRPEPARPTVRVRLAEIAGYVGAALVVGAAFFFVSEQWDRLTTGGRVATLVGIALVLVLAAAGVLATAPGGWREVRAGTEPVRRRLSSTLFTGAAASAAFAVGVALEAGATREDTIVLVAALTALLLIAAGYAVAPSLAGQLGGALAAVTAVVAGLQLVDSSDSGALGMGLGLVALGAAWALLVAAGALRERVGGTGIAGALALVGAQIPYLEGSERWWSYALTLLVAGTAFAVYTRAPSWPLLGVGVIGATLIVPEFLSDVTSGSLGVSGVMLAAGVALLASSAVGLRLRREVAAT